jgi:hypothetical protein
LQKRFTKPTLKDPLSIRRYRPTDRQRKQVELLAAAGDAPAAIAKTLGIELKTLRRYFSGELKHGQQRVRLEALESLATAARSGSAPAAGRLRDLVDKAVKRAQQPKPAQAVKLRPGIDRPLSRHEERIFAGWAHRGTSWESLIDDAPGEEPAWCVEYRAWLKARAA